MSTYRNSYPVHDETSLILLKISHLAATDDHDEGMKTAVGLPFLQKMEDARNNKAEDIYVPINLQVDKISRTRETKFPSLSGT